VTSLYIHVGTEKTGSSFLQKVCGHNREVLERHGVWFPGAGKYESMLMSGTISPGNAYELLQHVLASDWQRVAAWIGSRTSEAARRDCGQLLLSNEVLVAALSAENSLSRFIAAARDGGVEDIRAILFVRDPVDQALSLYKHRAKSGKTPAIGEWVESSFDVPFRIASFVAATDENNVNLTTRKYAKDSARMLRMFFSDWLGIDDRLEVREAVVNPSLTLSELRILHHVAKRSRHAVAFFYDELLSIPAADKANDKDLDLAARETLSKKLSEFESVWQELDRRLEEDGGLALPRPAIESASVEKHAYSLSDAQLRAIANANERSLAFRNQLVAFISTWVLDPARRLLPKLSKRRPGS
jgi:hypothetical protein